jgi:rSAM/selenodomain-associated transferase 2
MPRRSEPAVTLVVGAIQEIGMVSVVIPVLCERARLPGCLDAVLGQHGSAAIELIVVDGGSDDGTREVVSRRPAVRWIEAQRGRGRQMNVGARAARGSLLVFLPADTLLPDGAVERLRQIDSAGSPEAGGFRQRFDSPRRVLRAVSWLHNMRARCTGVCYGDQVPFVRRELFFAVGGYREEIDMEDVDLGARLRRRVRPRLLGLEATTSSRRFDQAGDLRATAVAAGLLLSRTFARRVPRSRTFFDPVR